MGRSMKKDKKDDYLTLRLKKGEKAAIQKMAEKEGLAVSKYARRKLLEPQMGETDKREFSCWFQAIWQELYNDIEEIYGSNEELEEQLGEKVKDLMKIWSSLL